MKGFVWAYSKGGHPNPRIYNRTVSNATAVEKGEPLNYKPGTGIIVLAGPTDFDDPIDVVSLVEKAANDGTTSIKVIEADGQVFKHHCSKVYTMTGGSTTTCVDSSLVPQTDNFWAGGAIRIVTCAADSSLVGRIVKISNSTGSTGSLALAETLPVALVSGNTYQLCPGNMALHYLGHDLDSDAMHPNWGSTGGNVLRLYDANPDTMDVFVTFERHANVS